MSVAVALHAGCGDDSEDSDHSSAGDAGAWGMAGEGAGGEGATGASSTNGGDSSTDGGSTSTSAGNGTGASSSGQGGSGNGGTAAGADPVGGSPTNGGSKSVTDAGHCEEDLLTCNEVSCCSSILVPGGNAKRGTSNAAVSAFRLDAYEVTVARFRAFAAAWDGGYRPSAGDGKHGHLAGGITNVAPTGGNTESGWDTDWAANVDTSSAARRTSGSVHPNATWTDAPGSNDDRPINFINWYEAYAFCIWDEGFLPSELERQYAATGSDERKYPWGDSEPQADSLLAVYGCYYGGGAGLCSTVDAIAPVGSVPAGDGPFGHSDLAGNIAEWTLDEYDGLLAACDDCAWLPGTSANRHLRGGSFAQTAGFLANTNRVAVDPDTRFDYIGVRCARVP